MSIPVVRRPEIDVLRSIAVLGMVAYHAAYDLQVYAGLPIDIFHGGWSWLQFLTAALFLSLVGAGQWLSSQRRSHQWPAVWQRAWRRSGGLLALALLVSAVTYMVDPVTYVRFGILHCIALSALILPWLRHGGYYTVLLGITILIISPWLHSLCPQTALLLPLGCHDAGFVSVDYFPLLPWLGWPLIGLGCSSIVYASTPPVAPAQSRLCTIATWPGRHALLLYMVHQPILLGLLWMAGL